MMRWLIGTLHRLIGRNAGYYRKSSPSTVELAVNAVAVGLRLHRYASKIDNRVNKSLKELGEIRRTSGDSSLVEKLVDTLFLIELGNALKKEARLLTVERGSTPYMVSSRFLHQCLACLVKDSGGNEKLHFITGSEIGPFKVLDEIIEFPMKYQTVAGACGELSSTHEKLVELDEWGHALHAIFHTHPGMGPLTTRPSHTDRSTQGRYERGGYLCIGGIFTRDGYVKFFSVKHKFRVYVHGKGVEQIDENLYRLKRPESL